MLRALCISFRAPSSFAPRCLQSIVVFFSCRFFFFFFADVLTWNAAHMCARCTPQGSHQRLSRRCGTTPTDAPARWQDTTRNKVRQHHFLTSFFAACICQFASHNMLVPTWATLLRAAWSCSTEPRGYWYQGSARHVRSAACTTSARSSTPAWCSPLCAYAPDTRSPLCTYRPFPLCTYRPCPLCGYAPATPSPLCTYAPQAAMRGTDSVVLCACLRTGWSRGRCCCGQCGCEGRRCTGCAR